MKKILAILALAAVLTVAIPAAVSADGVSADIPLKAGWNMVSVPLVPDNADASVVFGGLPVYWWNPVTKSYDYNPPIDPSKGYWVASTTDQVITVTGQPYTG